MLRKTFFSVLGLVDRKWYSVILILFIYLFFTSSNNSFFFLSVEYKINMFLKVDTILKHLAKKSYYFVNFFH